MGDRNGTVLTEQALSLYWRVSTRTRFSLPEL